MVSGRRPSKTRGFFTIFNSPARPSADFGLVNLRKLVVFCDFQIARAKSPARPSADFGLVDLRKLVVFCGFQIARATLCGLWAGRPSKTRGFFAIFKSPARPSADFGLVDLRKLVDFQKFRATLCGLWAGRPSKTRDELLLSNMLVKNFAFEAFLAQMKRSRSRWLRLRNAPLWPRRSSICREDVAAQ